MSPLGSEAGVSYLIFIYGIRVGNRNIRYYPKLYFYINQTKNIKMAHQINLGDC